MITSIQVSFEFLLSVLLGIYPRVEILGYSMVILSWYCRGITKLFPMAAASFYTATVLFILHVLIHTCYFFSHSLPSRRKMVYPWGFHLHFLMTNNVDHRLPFDKCKKCQAKPLKLRSPDALLNASKFNSRRHWSNWGSQRPFLILDFIDLFPIFSLRSFSGFLNNAQEFRR